MATLEATAAVGQTDEQTYRRRIRAWTMYDWANSAFATTILAAVLPVYYSQVAGATLPSEAAATALWSMGLSISLLLTAILGPILGTISDVVRGKKPFLAVFVGMGILATGLLVLVSTGDWFLASVLFILGRIGFTAANVFYDALLPHVARPDDRDRVSTRGYAMGYLGGGLLLAINVLMINFVPEWFDFAGIRLSLLSVALWWAVFSIPLFLRVPEPPAAGAALGPGENVISASFRQLGTTLREVRRYRELFKFLLAFLIYNDGIGTIIGVATIYGAELGLGTSELILALLMVQFVGIPFSLIFGHLPSKGGARRPQFLAFILFNIVALPLVGLFGVRLLPGALSGAPPPPYTATATAAGEGIYAAADGPFDYAGAWDTVTVPAEEISGGAFFEGINTLFGDPLTDAQYAVSQDANAAVSFPFNGQTLRLTHSVGPDHGVWIVLLDGRPYFDGSGEPVVIDARADSPRYGVIETIIADEPGEHTVTLANTGGPGTVLAFEQAEVMPPARQSNLLAIIGIILAVQAVGAAFAALFGRALFSGWVEHLDTKRSVILALVTYAIIAVWAFFINSTLELWLLAWMVAIVQGGSQALSRSLYSSMSPAAKSGEFFGLFGVMEKVSTIAGPILFAAAAAIFASSRPAILSLVLFFVVGIALLTRVDVEEGRRIAAAEDAVLLGGSAEPASTG